MAKKIKTTGRHKISNKVINLQKRLAQPEDVAEKTEAKLGIKDGKTCKIMGVSVSSTHKPEVLKTIVQVCNKNTYNRPFFVVTAYSEFFLEAQSDPEFAAALARADLVLPDGVSVPAAADFLAQSSGQTIKDFILGMFVGVRVLKGKYAEKTISGVKLTQELISIGAKKNWRIFLLGGYGRTAEILAANLKNEYPGLKVEWDKGQNLKVMTTDKYVISDTLMDRISRFQPDLLLVTFGRYDQEKWIAANLDKLKAKVVMGVGSSFDQMIGIGQWTTQPPQYVERMGLKWLWRAGRDPKHLRRAWRAFPVFAWKVFKSRTD